jgi:hypothetical protein
VLAVALSAEELLAGSGLTHEIEVPSALLAGNGGPREDGAQPDVGGRVVLRPLEVRDLQRVSKAARDDDELSAALMIQTAVAEPSLTLDQVSRLPAGLARFLVERINAVSGVSTARDRLQELVQAPLARACFVLARDFGWTPEEVTGMTVGQVLMYVEMSHTGGAEP